MNVLKVFFLILLLGGNYGLVPASLEAFPQATVGCDGRANLLFAPTERILWHIKCSCWTRAESKIN